MRKIEERVIRNLFREVEETSGPEIRAALAFMSQTTYTRGERAVIERLIELATEVAYHSDPNRYRSS